MLENFKISKVTKSECLPFLKKYHYLSKHSKGFRVGVNFGLFKDDILVGVCIFHSPSVPETTKGCFGLEKNHKNKIYELGRLCLKKDIKIKNILSWFLSKSIKLLRKEYNVCAILSYADSSLHFGYIYQATNFKYYGLTDKKNDFWFELDDGSFVKHQRGPVKNRKGEWRPRTEKHRYLLIFNDNLKCKWKESPYPKGNNKAAYNKKES